ncbi:MAG: prevent-host-death protein, partial [Bryobacterales bacterium]|nr:prevent-host-death protein [Bryobacterales bacterium]
TNRSPYKNVRRGTSLASPECTVRSDAASISRATNSLAQVRGLARHPLAAEPSYTVGVPVDTSYSNLRENLAAVLARADVDNEIFIVRRPEGRAIALIPADELASILETAHLLSSPAKTRRLRTALKKADSGQTPDATVDQLRRGVGLEPEG